MSQGEVVMLATSQKVSRRCIQELIDVGLWDTTEDGIAVHHYSAYLPDQSKERTAAWRERHGDESETKRDGHETVSRARLVPIPIPKPIPTPKGAKAPNGIDKLAEPIERIYAAWVEQVVSQYGPRSRPMKTPERVAAIRARLEQGYSEDDWLIVVRGWRESEHHVKGRYFDLTLLGRNGAKFEWFRDRALDALPVYHRQPRPADASDIAEAQRQTDEFDHEMTPLSEILAAMPGRN